MPSPPPASTNLICMPSAFQFADEFGYPVERGPERLGGLDLGSDVHADPDRVQVTRSL